MAVTQAIIAEDSPRKEIYIIFVMKGQKLLLGCSAWLIDVHVLVQAISQHQVVGEGQSLRLHGVSFLLDVRTRSDYSGESLQTRAALTPK